MKRVLLCALLLVMLSTVCSAKMDVPGRTDSWVNDYAGIMDSDSKAYLEEILSSVEQKTPEPIEIIIAVFPELDGWEFSEFAQVYGEKWREAKLGKRDNGVVILAALKEGRVAIGVGQNLKDVITDHMINDIIENLIVPEFQRGKFSEGIRSAAEKIVAILNESNIPTDMPIGAKLAIFVIIIVMIRLFRNKLTGQKCACGSK